MTLAPELLRAATGCTQDAADLYAEHLDAACTYYEITDQRLAMFLAQIAHESGSLRHVAELSTGEAYEGRDDLGNTRPGDGPRFKGRGLIQCTGRANYRRMTTWLDRLGCPDFETAPESLTAPRWAAWSAAAWWYHNGCNALADAGDYVGVGRLINRGNAKSVKPAIGEPDRLARYEAAKAAFQVRSAPQPRTDYEGAPAPQEITMPLAPVAMAVLPTIVEYIPKLGRLFGSGSEVAERNVKTAEMVVDLVTKATGAVNAQQAAEKLAADPGAVQAATKAIDAVWYELTEAGGGGIDGARKANAVYADPAGPRFWLNPAFWISMLLLSMPMMLLIDVFYVHPQSYTGEIRTQIVTGVLMVISMVGAYWIGTSFSSARKTELAGK